MARRKQNGTGSRLLRPATPPPAPRRFRGRSAGSNDLIEKMRAITEEAQPITGRGVGYKLFTQGHITSMDDMRTVYRLLLIAREDGTIPWEWIVDETRSIERVSTWSNPKAFIRAAMRSVRLDTWQSQPRRVQVWSEKGTVRGVLQPVLEEYAVGFNAVHGFNSGTNTHDAADDYDGKPLIILYVGDFDPSGMFMSEVDLPKRFIKYGGDHITLKRIALTLRQARGLPSFTAASKKADPRFKWFTSNHGKTCWELDAMDPNDLRNCVKREIKKLIDTDIWEQAEIANQAEEQSMREHFARMARLFGRAE